MCSEQDARLWELALDQRDELSRQGVIVRRMVDVSSAWLAVVPERPQIDVTPFLM